MIRGEEGEKEEQQKQPPGNLNKKQETSGESAPLSAADKRRRDGSPLQVSPPF